MAKQLYGGFDKEPTLRQLLTDGSTLALGSFSRHGAGTPAPGIFRLLETGAADTTFSPATADKLRVELRSLVDARVTRTQFEAREDRRGRLCIRPRAGASPGDARSKKLKPYCFRIGEPMGGEAKIVERPDGKILVAGHFSSDRKRGTAGLFQLTKDGSLDAQFMKNVSGALGNDDSVDDLLLMPDGRVLLAGWFAGFKESCAYHVARLNADGSVDRSFGNNLGGGFDDQVRTLALDGQGRILVEGEFKSFGAAQLRGAARLLKGGALDLCYSQRLGRTLERASPSDWLWNSPILKSDGSLTLKGNSSGCGNECETCKTIRVSVDPAGRLSSKGKVETSFSCKP